MNFLSYSSVIYQFYSFSKFMSYKILIGLSIEILSVLNYFFHLLISFILVYSQF